MHTCVCAEDWRARYLDSVLRSHPPSPSPAPVTPPPLARSATSPLSLVRSASQSGPPLFALTVRWRAQSHPREYSLVPRVSAEITPCEYY
jgi:hypothetical protein